MSEKINFPEISQNEHFELFKSDLNTNNLNFNQYKSKVYRELSSIESEIVSELLTNDKELMSMLINFNESEKILNSLESSLIGFKEQLSGINSEMKLLQIKSNEISSKLKNRKEFEENLYCLLDSIILAPEFLNELTNKEVEEDFIKKIEKLDHKLKVFVQGELPDARSVKEIIPEMQKTLAKVCSKIYIFLVNKFQMFQKPNTNIHMIQSAVFLKNHLLIEFLKKHAIVMFNDLVNKYICVMEKIYSQGTQTYIHEIQGLINDKSEKNTLISSEDINKDLILLIENRISNSLNNIDGISIIPTIAKQKQQKFHFEEIFKSLNKFVMDLIVSEVLFFNDFFNLDPHRSSSKLNEMFKSTVTQVCDFLKRGIILKTNDFVAICLMIILNFEQSSLMINQKLNHLEFYFESLSTSLWPKFDEIFKKYTDYFFKQNSKNSKSLVNGIHVVTTKLGEFLSLITIICKKTTQSPMLMSRIKQIQKQFNQFYSEVAENNKLNSLEREEHICLFFINNLYYLLKKLDGFDEILVVEDPESFNKTFSNRVESYLSLLFRKYFEDINKITLLCLIKNDNEFSKKNSNNNVNTSNYNNDNFNNEYNKQSLEKLNSKDLKVIAINFNSKHKDLIELAKKDIYDNIKGRENAINIFKKFVQEVIVFKYFHFLEILKQSGNEELTSLTITYQKFMIEINNLLKSIS